MSQYKNLACFFFFIFSFVWSPCAYTMDTDEDILKFLPGNNNAGFSQFPQEQQSSAALLEVPEEQKLLERVFGRTVSRVRVPESLRQTLSGLASLLPLFPTGQVFVPLSIIGLLSLGLTTNIVPDVGWESWALVGGVAIPIAIAALIGTYNGASNFFKPTSSDVEAQQEAFERPYSRLESWSQSPPTQFVELAFWGSLFFAILMNVESRVTGWGDYRILGSIFGSLATVAVFFIVVRACNDMGRYSYRSYENKDEEAQKNVILEPIEAAKEYFKEHGIDPTKNTIATTLAQQLNIVTSHLPTNTDIEDNHFSQGDNQNRSNLLLEDIGVDHSTNHDERIRVQDSQLGLVDELAKPEYQKVFEKMIAIKNITPVWKKNWNTWSTEIAKYSSRTVQVGSLVAQELIAFALPFSLFTYLAAPPAITWSVSALSVLAYNAALPGITVRENALVWKEHEQLLRLYKPQITSGYWGERIAPFAARAGTLLYFTFPMSDFIRNELLNKVIGITNVPAQIIILLPFMAGIGLAAPSQFLDSTYTTLSNWMATGGRITLPYFEYSFKLSRLFHPLYYYLCCCCFCADENGREGALEAMEQREQNRELAFETVVKLQEMENSTFYLNPGLTKFLTNQLGITPPSLEETRLLQDNTL